VAGRVQIIYERRGPAGGDVRGGPGRSRRPGHVNDAGHVNTAGRRRKTTQTDQESGHS